MKRLGWIIAYLAFLSLNAQAGLPPTTLKGISDTAGKVTFNTALDIPVTRSGVTATAYVSSIVASKNYLSPIQTSNGTNTGNGDFEQGTTTGWSLAHSALTSGAPTSTATPGTGFDSTHGGTAASANLSLSAVTSGSLQKKYSGQIVSSAASTAGDMLISTPFNIDKADQTAPMTITLNSGVTSGATNLNFSGTSSNSFAIYVYDVTAGAWIQPAGVYGMVSSGTYKVKSVVFQPQSSTSTQYQLAVININASAGAYTMLMDDFTVGPQAAVNAPAMSDWADYTPTISGCGTATISQAQHMRSGQMDKIRATFTCTTAAASVLKVSLPSGETATQATDTVLQGSFQSSYTGATQAGIFPLLLSADTTDIQFGKNNSASGFSPVNANSVSVNGSLISITADVPVITGWSSNTASSADSDTRVIASRYHNLNGVLSYASTAVLKFTSQDWDYSGSYNTATGLFTCPVTGVYRVTGSYYASAGSYIYIGKNGNTEAVRLSTQTMNGVPTSAQVQCNSGDTLGLYVAGATTISNDATAYSYVQFERMSGPAVVQATESVHCRYENHAGNTITNSFTVSAFETKIEDDHSAFSGNNTFTAPSPGSYSIDVQMSLNASYTTSQGFNLKLFKNTSTLIGYASTVGSGGTGVDYTPHIHTKIHLNQGDTIQVQAFSSTSQAINSGAGFNVIAIDRVGN